MDFVKTHSFVVCADVFTTLHELFRRHKTLASDVLQKDYDIFFPKINELISSKVYYIRRKSIKLLSEILLDRNHQKVMKKYVNESQNMTIIENIMKSDCIYTSFDGFLIFSLFVKNPMKSDSIKRDLIRDKTNLMSFLERFQSDQPNVKQYENDKKELIKTLMDLI